MLTAHTRLVPAVRRADTRAKTQPRPAAEPERLESTSPYPRSFEAREEGRESLPYLELEIATDRQDTLEAHFNEGTTAKRPPLRIVKTVSRKIGVGTGPEQALPLAACKAVAPQAPALAAGTPDPDERPTAAIEKQTVVELDPPAKPSIDDIDTAAVAKQRAEDALEPSVVDDDLELSTQRVVKMLESLSEASASSRKQTEANGPAPRPSMLQWLGVVLTQPEVGAALMIGTWLRPEFRVTSPVARVFARGDGVLVQTITKSRYFVGPNGDTYLVRSADQGTRT